MNEWKKKQEKERERKSGRGIEKEKAGREDMAPVQWLTRRNK